MVGHKIRFPIGKQVRLMGDFDDWTRGVNLSAEDMTGDHVFSRFTATLLLPKVRQLLSPYIREI